METIKKNLEERSRKTISILKEDLNTVRAGRANPALLDKVMVDYYGSPTPLKNLSNISVPDPRTLMITPFDPKSISEIEKAINIANIGINPSNDGKCVRLVIPQVTEERRKELTKTVKKMGEDSKVAVRNLRREANDELKKLEKNHDARFRINWKMSDAFYELFDENPNIDLTKIKDTLTFEVVFNDDSVSKSVVDISFDKNGNMKAKPASFQYIHN